MRDVFEVADLLVSHAVDTHGDDVDLIAYHGSHAQGAARDDSDLDIFYVPRDGTNPPVGKTFLLEGRLFDFWPIRWETLEAFATGRVRGWAFAPALVHHATPLHVRSEAQATRLTEVKALVLERMRPEARPRMLARAFDAFRNVLADVGAVRLATLEGGISDVRFVGWQVVQSAIECLALANQTFFHRGMGVGLGQLEELPRRPPDLERWISAIGASPDPALVAGACEETMLGTRRVLRDLRAELPIGDRTLEPLAQVYPEMKDMIAKLAHHCGRSEVAAAGIGAWFLQSDLCSILGRAAAEPGHPGLDLLGERSSTYAEIGLPGLLGPAAGDTDDLADRARSLDRRLRRWLVSQGVDLCEYATLDDLRRSL